MQGQPHDVPTGVPTGVPTDDPLRVSLAALDPLDRKVLGGLVACLIAESHRVHDREWVAECFVQLAIVAHDFDGNAQGHAAMASATSDDVARIQDYAKRRMPEVVHLALRLLVRAADELRARGGAFDFADAQSVVKGYLGELG